jgi:hypothetical protein
MKTSSIFLSAAEGQRTASSGSFGAQKRAGSVMILSSKVDSVCKI